MSPQVYFSVQCTYSIVASDMKIVFDRVLVNAGSAWNKATNTFTAPYTGNCFFSVTAAVATGNGATILLFVNSVGKGLAYDRPASSHNGTVIARGAVMLSLSINDVVSFQSSGTLYSTTDGLINAQGFYYSPVGGNATAVAWSIEHYSGFSGPTTVLKFGKLIVNIQNVWNTTSNKATIPAAGMYLIDLTINFYGYGTGGNGNDG
jgi:hypothetical protein